MITSEDIVRQVRQSLPGVDQDYDVIEIAVQIIMRFGRVDIDAIDHDVYWAIVADNDITPAAVESRNAARSEA